MDNARDRERCALSPDITDAAETFTSALLALLMACTRASTPPEALYLTGGPSPALPPGYLDRRVLDDAARKGELAAVPVPNCGWRITASALAAWEATRTRKRKRKVAAVATEPANDARDEDRKLLASVGGAPRRKAS